MFRRRDHELRRAARRRRPGDHDARQRADLRGEHKLFADNIQNFSTNPYRRVDLLAQRLSAIPDVMDNRALTSRSSRSRATGPVLAVRPYCSNLHYWQVYFDTNRVIREAFGEAGFPAPEQHFAVRSGA